MHRWLRLRTIVSDRVPRLEAVDGVDVVLNGLEEAPDQPSSYSSLQHESLERYLQRRRDGNVDVGSILNGAYPVGRGPVLLENGGTVLREQALAGLARRPVRKGICGTNKQQQRSSDHFLKRSKE